MSTAENPPPVGDHEARPPAEPAPTGASKRKRRLIGRVTSDRMQKTVVVEVIRFKRDPVYKKYIRERAKYKAHDENNQYKTGDRVEIIEHRPISRDKCWKVIRLIERPAVELTQKEPIA